MPETLPIQLDDEEQEKIDQITRRVDKKAQKQALRDASTLDEIAASLQDDDLSIEDKIYLNFKGQRVMNDRHHRRMRNLEASMATAGAIGMMQLAEIRQLQKGMDVS